MNPPLTGHQRQSQGREPLEYGRVRIHTFEKRHAALHTSCGRTTNRNTNPPFPQVLKCRRRRIHFYYEWTGADHTGVPCPHLSDSYCQVEPTESRCLSCKAALRSDVN